jgi:hypothetical protein
VLARLARVFLVVALLAGWQAALGHSVEHGASWHEDGPLCGALDGLTACAAQEGAKLAPINSVDGAPALPFDAPRLAERPPFLSHGPPASV